jgi:cytochrome P450 family 6
VLRVADPELIKTILVKDFHLFPDRRARSSLHPIMRKNLVDLTGSEWRRVRGVISPTFTSGKMKRMYPLIRECLKDFMDHLDVFAKDRKDINVKDVYGNYTMDVIATCAFATKINSHKQLDSPFVLNARKSFDFNMFKIVLATIIPRFVAKIIIGSSSGSNDFFLDQVKKMIDNRKKSDKRFNDFLQLALDVQQGVERDVQDKDDNDADEAHHVNEGKLSN